MIIIPMENCLDNIKKHVASVDFILSPMSIESSTGDLIEMTEENFIDDSESNTNSEITKKSFDKSIIRLVCGIIIVIGTLFLLGLIGSSFIELNYCTSNFNFGYCLLSGIITIGLTFLNSLYFLVIDWPIGYLIIYHTHEKMFDIKDCIILFCNIFREKYPIHYLFMMIIHVVAGTFIIPLIGTLNIIFPHEFCSISTYRKDFMTCSISGLVSNTIVFFIIYMLLGISWIIGSICLKKCLRPNNSG